MSLTGSENGAKKPSSHVRLQLGPQASYNRQVNLHMGNLWKELEADNKRLASENNALVEELRKAKEVHAQQVIELARSRGETRDVQRELHVTQAAGRQLQEQCDAQTMTIQSQGNSIDNLKAQMKVLQAGIEALKSRVEDLMEARDAALLERDARSNDLRQVRKDLQQALQEVIFLQNVREEKEKALVKSEDALRILKQSNQTRDRTLAKQSFIKKQLLGLIHRVQEIAKGPGALVGSLKLQKAILSLLSDERVNAAASGVGLPNNVDNDLLLASTPSSQGDALESLRMENEKQTQGESHLACHYEKQVMDETTYAPSFVSLNTHTSNSNDTIIDSNSAEGANLPIQDKRPIAESAKPIVKLLSAKGRIELMTQQIQKLNDTIRALKTENQVLTLRLRQVKGEQSRAKFELKITRDKMGQIVESQAASTDTTEDSGVENASPRNQTQSVSVLKEAAPSISKVESIRPSSAQTKRQIMTPKSGSSILKASSQGIASRNKTGKTVEVVAFSKDKDPVRPLVRIERLQTPSNGSLVHEPQNGIVSHSNTAVNLLSRASESTKSMISVNSFAGSNVQTKKQGSIDALEDQGRHINRLLEHTSPESFDFESYEFQ